jgi:hypothetical protein
MNPIIDEKIKAAGLAMLPLSLGYRGAVALGKATPYIGAGISAIGAGSRFLEKDYLGSLIDAGAAVADLTPAGPVLGGSLAGINMIRDVLRDVKDKDEEPNDSTEKAASSQFKRDLEDPNAGLDSDFYSAISPMISSESDNDLRGADAARINDLKEQVRKGIVGMQYATGTKQNQGNTFYDEHPTQAVAADLLGHAGTAGVAVGGGLALHNIAKQISNMHKTEPGGMSRDKNNKDPFSPGRLLKDPSGRPDVTRLFGDLENNPELRLSIYDKLNEGQTSFMQQHRAHKQMKDELTAKHNARIGELQSEIAKNPKDVEKINSMMKAHSDAHGRELAKIDAASKELFSQAERSPGAAHLDKYVNLHESLRAAKEKGGLASMHGEGFKHLGGAKDLIERRNITGAHGGFNEELLQNILRNHAGTNAMDAEWQRFAAGPLAELADPKHQASGIKKMISRFKGPALAGGFTAAGGYGLYKLLKMMQEQNYSSDKINNWKKTLLQSQGDFDRAAKYDKENQQEQQYV